MIIIDLVGNYPLEKNGYLNFNDRPAQTAECGR